MGETPISLVVDGVRNTLLSMSIAVEESGWYRRQNWQALDRTHRRSDVTMKCSTTPPNKIETPVGLNNCVKYWASCSCRSTKMPAS